MTAVCLHNFRIIENEPVNEFVSKDETSLRARNFNLDSIDNCLTDSTSVRGQFVRDELAEYFILGGRVPWQDGLIHY